MAAEAHPDFDNACISDEYTILDPNNVTFKELFKFLFRKDNQKCKFVRTKSFRKDEKNNIPFEDRRIIFICLFIQKLLLFVSSLLKWVGSKLEMWLNICYHYRNISGLFRNLCRWKMPQTNGETYFSFIGCLDKRMELPNHIKHGDPKYYSSIAVMASKLSYENLSHIKRVVTQVWKMEFIGFYDFWNVSRNKKTTQALIFRIKNVDPELTIVAFRGTEAFDADDWCTDFDISWYNLEMIKGKGKVKVHHGFMKALGHKSQEWQKSIKEGVPDKKLAYYEIRKILKEVLSENDKGKFIVTGHSLGGALAVLFPAILSLHKEKDLLDKMEGVYTFGQPRVGDQEFGNFMKDMFKDNKIGYHRFVYGNDIVPRLPYNRSRFRFKHFGSCILFDSSYNGRVVDKEPNWNSIEFWNALKELKRSFTIAREKGIDYKEGWTLLFIRMVGLVIPGFSAHSLRDYDNSVRLGSNDIFQGLYN